MEPFLPETLELLDYISFQEQKENPNKERKKRKDAEKHEISFLGPWVQSMYCQGNGGGPRH